MMILYFEVRGVHSLRKIMYVDCGESKGRCVVIPLIYIYSITPVPYNISMQCIVLVGVSVDRSFSEINK